MNNKYTNESNKICDSYEAICTYNLSQITGVTGCRWFSTVTENPQKNRIDYNFTNGCKTGKLEIKTRSCLVDDYPTIYIEPDKFIALKNSTTDFKWYLNFMENTKDKFWICDISKLEQKELKTKLVERIWDRATKTYKTEYRLLIPINKGVYLEFDQEQNKYVKLELDERTKKYIR
jgi:hypothetical protein